MFLIGIPSIWVVFSRLGYPGFTENGNPEKLMSNLISPTTSLFEHPTPPLTICVNHMYALQQPQSLPEGEKGGQLDEQDTVSRSSSTPNSTLSRPPLSGKVARELSTHVLCYLTILVLFCLLILGE